MKIRDAHVLRASRPYRRPFCIAGGVTYVADHVFVELTAENGLRGYGEAAPMPSYSRETPESVITALEGGMLDQVRGESVFDVERILGKLDAVSTRDPFAAAAVDFALHDLMGKCLGTPCYNLLGGKVRDRVDLSWAVGMGEIEAMVEEAARYADLGYRTVKLKVGRDPGRDLEAVRSVRQRLGPCVRLRVDANQGYGLEEARRILPELERFDLEMIEQPVHRDDIESMAALRADLDTPILADESLFSLEDALDLIRHEACDAFNIKVMKSGGLRRSSKIAALAEAAGIPVSVGSMVEMGPGTAAGLHFALAVPGVRYAAEMIGHEMIDGDVIEEAEWIASCRNGHLGVPEEPGLGFCMAGDLERVD